MLILRIADAMRMIGVIKFYNMATNVMRRAGEWRTQRSIHIGSQRLPTTRIFADTNIRVKQVHHRIQVAHIECQRIFGGELAYRI